MIKSLHAAQRKASGSIETSIRPSIDPRRSGDKFPRPARKTGGMGPMELLASGRCEPRSAGTEAWSVDSPPHRGALPIVPISSASLTQEKMGDSRVHSPCPSPSILARPCPHRPMILPARASHDANSTLLVADPRTYLEQKSAAAHGASRSLAPPLSAQDLRRKLRWPAIVVTSLSIRRWSSKVRVCVPYVVLRR